MACVHCHMSAMSGLKGSPLWDMVEPYPYGMIVGCYGLSNHVLHLLKPCISLTDEVGVVPATHSYPLNDLLHNVSLPKPYPRY